LILIGVNYCKGNFIDNACITANKIIEEHGETCETYKDAKTFLSDWNKLVEKYSDGIKKNIVTYENESDFDSEADDLEQDF